MTPEQTAAERASQGGAAELATSARGRRPVPRRTRVLVADDHAIVRSGVRSVLEPLHDLEVVGEAASPAEVVGHPALRTADVLLLDADMPGAEPRQILSECRRRAPRPRVLLFAAHTLVPATVDAIPAGAAGMVGKDRPVDELVQAVHAVARGGTYVSDVGRVGASPSEVLPHETLSARERQIFDRLVRGASPGQIATELRIGTSTVATYLQRIREKFDVESTFELVRYALRRKLVA